jgi:hypothetical protein
MLFVHLSPTERQQLVVRWNAWYDIRLSTPVDSAR